MQRFGILTEKNLSSRPNPTVCSQFSLYRFVEWLRGVQNCFSVGSQDDGTRYLPGPALTHRCLRTARIVHLVRNRTENSAVFLVVGRRPNREPRQGGLRQFTYTIGRRWHHPL